MPPIFKEPERLTQKHSGGRTSKGVVIARLHRTSVWLSVCSILSLSALLSVCNDFGKPKFIKPLKYNWLGAIKDPQ